jgi:hypothetical protein
MRVELMVEVLQTSALPLGYRAEIEGVLSTNTAFYPAKSIRNDG